MTHRMRLTTPLDEHTEKLATRIVGAAIEVHRHLGPGLLESVYESAMCVELTAARIPFVRQAHFDVTYRGERVGDGRLDLLVDDRIIVELKAVDGLAPVHQAQVISYLRATGHRLGLLINFNVPVLKDGVRRVIL